MLPHYRKKVRKIIKYGPKMTISYDVQWSAFTG